MRSQVETSQTNERKESSGQDDNESKKIAPGAK